VSGNGNNSIYSLLSIWITTWMEPEALYEYSLPLQMKSFDPKNFQISCMGSKVPFWQFFRNQLISWIGHALLVQPSISAHKIFFSIFYFDFNFFF
jgi:hypothetical protein